MSLEELKGIPLRCCILTVSDTRTIETDKGGNQVEKLLHEANHEVVHRQIVHDEYNVIYEAVMSWLKETSIDVIITTGGTGIAKRDVTIESVSAIIEKEIPGFGELFRYLSYTEDIGTKAMASRAIAGVHGHTLLFALPGSVGAVTLGMTKLVIPEAPHLMREITK